jgi:hypothetical protein
MGSLAQRGERGHQARYAFRVMRNAFTSG